MTERPVFVVWLRAEPEVEPWLALRRLLKLAPRVCGLRCLKVTEAR